MGDLLSAAYVEVLLFLWLLAAIIAYRILTRTIVTRNLLRGRDTNGTLFFSPLRVQLIVITLWTAGTYLLDAMQHSTSGKLPEVSPTALTLLAASNSAYLGGKARAMLFGGNTDAAP